MSEPGELTSMAPSLARSLAHTVHAATFLYLLGSGMLLLSPSLRAAVTGGYSLAIGESHRWVGVLFVVAPAALLAIGRWVRVAESPASLWKRLHLSLSALLTPLFGLTGVLLWQRQRLSEPMLDGSLALHDLLTCAAAMLLAGHLIVVTARILARRSCSPRATAIDPARSAAAKEDSTCSA
jgi:cytochrome b subunit of formate dehydrogenase